MIENFKREFIIGEEWFYLKLYTGPKTSELILTECFKTITEELIDNSVIDKWFFIRYYDNGYHLRLRFHYIERNGFSKIIDKLKNPLREFCDLDLVWKIQIENYKREIERYGCKNIDLSESIFYFDSKMMMNLFNQISGEEGEDIRWLFGLRAIDELLSNFKFTLSERKSLLEHLKTGFGNEFNMNRYLKKQLDYKYRIYNEKIDQFLSLSFESHNEKYSNYLGLLKIRSNEITPLVENIICNIKESNIAATLLKAQERKTAKGNSYAIIKFISCWLSW